jgi:hypothetical protein
MFAYVCGGDCSSSERLRPIDREYDFAIDGAGMAVFCACCFLRNCVAWVYVEGSLFAMVVCCMFVVGRRCAIPEFAGRMVCVDRRVL